MSYLCVFMQSCYIYDGPLGSALNKMAAILSWIQLKRKKNNHKLKKKTLGAFAYIIFSLRV